MAGKGATFENDLLKLIFQALAIANIADNAASAPISVIEVALHTADPTDAGNQTSNEVAYTGYARVAVARNNTTGWTVTNSSVSPMSIISFPQRSDAGTTVVATHWSAGTAHTGTGKILYSGTVTPNISISQNVTPQLTTASTVTEG